MNLNESCMTLEHTGFFIFYGTLMVSGRPVKPLYRSKILMEVRVLPVELNIVLWRNW